MHVFLTGPVQIGKSTLIAAALEQLRPERLGGFRTISAKPEADGSRPVYLHPAAAQDLQKKIYGETNITLNENRVTAIDVMKRGSSGKARP